MLWLCVKHTCMLFLSCMLLQDDLYAIMPILSITELVIILIYLGHISGCFFYLLSTPAWQTKREFIIFLLQYVGGAAQHVSAIVIGGSTFKHYGQQVPRQDKHNPTSHLVVLSGVQMRRR